MQRWNSVDKGLQDERTPPNFRCIECGEKPRLTDGKEIYPHREDLHSKHFYVCDKCPSSYCGCHPDTTTPLGYPCGAQTRKARGIAHAVIDPIWREKIAGRRYVYNELGRRLGLERDKCHVAWMTATEARHAADVAREIRKDIESGKLQP